VTHLPSKLAMTLEGDRLDVLTGRAPSRETALLYMERCEKLALALAVIAAEDTERGLVHALQHRREIAQLALERASR